MKKISLFWILIMGTSSLIVLNFTSCDKPLEKMFITQIDELPEDLMHIFFDEKTCKDPLAYAPDVEYPEHTPVRHLRVNVHYLATAKGTRNFRDPVGEKYTKDLMYYANKALDGNEKMKLPLGNSTPALNPRFRYKLVGDDRVDNRGIYYHEDDQYHYILKKGPHKNLYDRKVFDKYGIRKDTVLNIFSFGFPEDSIKSPSFKRKDHGIAFRSWVKLANWYDNFIDTTWNKDGTFRIKRGANYTKSLLNHEIGHVLGLAHSWVRNDGCDDTPSHPNCWNYTKNGSKCDSLVSNNVMDYNAYQNAYSPCQLGKIHYNFSKLESRQRRMLDPRWCTLERGNKKIIIQDSIVWNSAKDIEGDLIIKDSASLVVRCRLSLPETCKIIVEPGGTLVLHENLVHNSCNYDWQGIEVQKQGKKEAKVYRIGQIQIQNAIHTIADSLSMLKT